jgi:HK97 family phage prohead protease
VSTTITDERTTITVPLTLHPEARSDGKLRLRGVAAVFNSPSEDLGGFRETIEPGAFREALRDGDPILLWQHDTKQPLARVSAGNLTLAETSRGLEFEAELPETSLAKDALTLVRSGVVKAMSFAFSMRDGLDRWETRDGEQWRFISKIGKLFEVSLVSEPAYAATSVAARQLAEARATQAKRGRLKVREPEAYGPDGGQYSWFMDKLVVSRSQHIRRLLVDQAAWDSTGMPHTGLDPSPAYPSDALEPEQAQRRLDRSTELRALTTTATAGGNFVPHTPEFIGTAFAEAARAASVLTSILPTEPLPKGMSLKTPRITTGTSTVAQAAQNSAISETDLVEELVSNPVALVAGMSNVSQQLFDNADPSLVDAYLAGELGRALGTAVDQQILAGTGANGQMLGLLSVTGITTVAYTDASPTQAECYPTIAKAYGDQSVALGNTATAILMHPRRSAWFSTWKDTATGMQSPIRWPATVYEVPAISVLGGAGTNEDYILVLRVEELPVYLAQPIIEVFPEVNSATLQVRIRAMQYVSGLFARRPEAIYKISGTGLAAPAYA